ncbi:MAG: MaoC/PaaZ C-terminal domain-containing protein [bacterium]
MSIPLRYVLQQGPVIASLGRTALSAARQPKGGGARGPVTTPGAEIRATMPPRSRELTRDYVRHVGGNPDAYGDRLPAHFFPQWGFALAARTLEGIPYPLMKVLNGGCRVEIAAPLPASEPLEVSARLEGVDDDGRRAVLHQRIVTGTRSVPAAITAHLYAIVPLGGGKKSGAASGDPDAKKKEVATVPSDARELARWSLAGNAGLDFAKLTGDFNPVHWIRSYARAFGFKSTILHGFSTMARAWEGVVSQVLGGDPNAVASFDARFTKPLVLPAKVGLYVVTKEGAPRSGEVFVGDAAGSPAYLVGSFTATS